MDIEHYPDKLKGLDVKVEGLAIPPEPPRYGPLIPEPTLVMRLSIEELDAYFELRYFQFSRDEV